jgi:antitoxin StbD
MKLLSFRTDLGVSISDLKRNPMGAIDAANGSAAAVLNHNEPVAYLVPALAYEALMDMVDDLLLAETVRTRRNKNAPEIGVDWNAL